MQSFDSDGVRIAYIDEGKGEPILLIHGFASNVATNWRDAHWVRTLTEAGRRVIAYDNRGHGHSEKLYDPKPLRRAGDGGGRAPSARSSRHRPRRRDGLFDGRAHRACSSSSSHPERVRSLVLGGAGINLVRGMVGTGPIARALEAPRIEDVTNDTARSFRAFAEQTGSDLKALAACMRGPREKITAEDLASDRRADARRDRQRGRDRRLGQRACKSDPGCPTP